MKCSSDALGVRTASKSLPPQRLYLLPATRPPLGEHPVVTFCLAAASAAPLFMHRDASVFADVGRRAAVAASGVAAAWLGRSQRFDSLCDMSVFAYAVLGASIVSGMLTGYSNAQQAGVGSVTDLLQCIPSSVFQGAQAAVIGSLGGLLGGWAYNGSRPFALNVGSLGTCLLGVIALSGPLMNAYNGPVNRS